MITLCPLCERDIRDHEVVLIDGDEGHTCTSDRSGEETQKILMDWLFSLEDKSDTLPQPRGFMAKISNSYEEDNE